ncbi:Protein of unknown function [Pseudomonas sp. NFACC52]|nr:Protein of unknown function [Pseudomonas sp. NFACC56-3]SFK95131.1 Protein of unknown function [Pseudomonas sp. NFACC52]
MPKKRVLLVGLVTCTVAGCVAPPSPAVRAFGDNKFWMTLEDMPYVIGSTKERIVVPKGFVTDYASIPQTLWSLGLSQHGQYSRAALIHDYLYWSQGCKREQADRLLVLAMKESKVGQFDEFLVYQGVNLGGGGPWNDNAKERKANLPRVVPERYLKPSDPNVTWPTYRAMLVGQGVKDPSFKQNPSYCRYGDSTKVP